MTTHSQARGAAGRREALAAAAFAMLLGSLILFGVGLAQPSLLHDDAHDSRHAFPCYQSLIRPD